jgi:hypothetical protein
MSLIVIDGTAAVVLLRSGDAEANKISPLLNGMMVGPVLSVG